MGAGFCLIRRTQFKNAANLLYVKSVRTRRTIGVLLVKQNSAENTSSLMEIASISNVSFVIIVTKILEKVSIHIVKKLKHIITQIASQN